MSAETNPRIRACAKALKRCNRMIGDGESLQIVLLEAYYQGAQDALDFFTQDMNNKGGKKRARKSR